MSAMTLSKSPLPTHLDYNVAVANFERACTAPRYAGGKPRLRRNGTPIRYSGGYSCVYVIDLPNHTAALRCWTNAIQGAETRYTRMIPYLRAQGLPYFVDCEYIPECIFIGNQPMPALYMDWVEADTLKDFVAANVNDAGMMRAAAAAFLHMARDLHIHQIAHGRL
ncbi:MAG: hypothetical protein IAE80_19460 [Anaerolinea sp.]|nr:hypothetical protein [Anaerolinea sp.]